MTTTATGRQAEFAAALFLERQGLRILERNHRTRWSEIDLVARDRRGRLHIVEVKYRARSDWGSGFEYITPAKQERLRRAATMLATQLHAGDFQIDIIQVSGNVERPQIDYLPNAVEG